MYLCIYFLLIHILKRKQKGLIKYDEELFFNFIWWPCQQDNINCQKRHI